MKRQTKAKTRTFDFIEKYGTCVSIYFSKFSNFYINSFEDKSLAYGINSDTGSIKPHFLAKFKLSKFSKLKVGDIFCFTRENCEYSPRNFNYIVKDQRKPFPHGFLCQALDDENMLESKYVTEDWLHDDDERNADVWVLIK